MSVVEEQAKELGSGLGDDWDVYGMIGTFITSEGESLKNL